MIASFIDKIVSNILISLYQPFWFAVLLSVFVLFFYLFSYDSSNAGKGWKESCKAWIEKFKIDVFFRKLFFLTFFTVLILFRTLLNRSMWANPVSNVMGGWWIWKVDTNGEKVLTTECFENIILMFPFTVLLMWTAKEKMIKHLNIKNIILKCTQEAFLFSVCIEFLQLFLRLGTFQLSDIFYNTCNHDGAVLSSSDVDIRREDRKRLEEDTVQ